MDARLMVLEREKNKLDKEKKLLEDEENRLMMENTEYRVWREKSIEKNRNFERASKLESLKRSLKVKAAEELKLVNKANIIAQKATYNLKLNSNSFSKIQKVVKSKISKTIKNCKEKIKEHNVNKKLKKPKLSAIKENNDPKRIENIRRYVIGKIDKYIEIKI